MTEYTNLVRLDYVNWENKRSLRLVTINSIDHRGTPHHPIPQYMLNCRDVIKEASRSFALADIKRHKCVTQADYQAAVIACDNPRVVLDRLCNAPWQHDARTISELTPISPMRLRPGPKVRYPDCCAKCGSYSYSVTFGGEATTFTCASCGDVSGITQENYSIDPPSTPSAKFAPILRKVSASPVLETRCPFCYSRDVVIDTDGKGVCNACGQGKD